VAGTVRLMLDSGARSWVSLCADASAETFRVAGVREHRRRLGRARWACSRLDTVTATDFSLCFGAGDQSKRQRLPPGRSGDGGWTRYDDHLTDPARPAGRAFKPAGPGYIQCPGAVPVASTTPVSSSGLSCRRMS
jgi:hypothetical protein